MSCFVYILRTSSNTLYVGQTNNLEKRLEEHQLKSSKSAKCIRYFSSVELVYSEKYPTRKEAMQREIQLKKWSRVKKMKENIREALETILSEVSATKFIWAVVGSTSLALQGVNIEAHDIDILTTEGGIFKLEKILKKFMTEPVKYTETEFFKSYFGKLRINGVKVEVMANLQTKQKSANWSEESRLDKVIFINYKNLSVPVIPLIEEYKTYMRMGRIETAKKVQYSVD